VILREQEALRPIELTPLTVLIQTTFAIKTQQAQDVLVLGSAYHGHTSSMIEISPYKVLALRTFTHHDNCCSSASVLLAYACVPTFEDFGRCMSCSKYTRCTAYVSSVAALLLTMCLCVCSMREQGALIKYSMFIRYVPILMVQYLALLFTQYYHAACVTAITPHRQAPAAFAIPWSKSADRLCREA
jgi:hypothetical protein